MRACSNVEKIDLGGERKLGQSGSQSVMRQIISIFKKHGVLAAVLVGFLTRATTITIVHHWDGLSVPFNSDDTLYVRIASTLVETGRLATDHFPVGYSLFVAFFLKLGSVAFPAIRFVQILLGLVTIFLVSRITTILYGGLAGIFAAWIAALYPPLIYMTGRILSETLFIALLMLSMFQFLVSDRDQSLPRSLLGSALFAFASIVRSNLIIMLAYIPIWVLSRPHTSLRARCTTAIGCTAVAVAILVLPGIYFLVSKGEFVPFATNSGQTFYGANNPLADGGWVQVEDHPELLISIPAQVRRSTTAYSRAQQQLGFKWIEENPWAFAALLPKKFANAWIPGFQKSETTSRSKLAAFAQGASLGLIIFGFVAGRLLVKPATRDGILLSVLAAYTIMSLIFYGNPRIGLICAPILIVYSAASVVLCVRWLFPDLVQAKR
jgi:hypothetical protein